MAKKKQPAPKRGGKKKVAPKKAPARKKPIPQQVVERSAEQRVVLKSRGAGLSTLHAAHVEEQARKASALQYVDVSEPQHPTVEEQAGSLFGGPGTVVARTTFYPTLPAQKPDLLRRALHRARSLFRFRSAKTGQFVTSAEDQANPDTTIRERVD